MMGVQVQYGIGLVLTTVEGTKIVDIVQYQKMDKKKTRIEGTDHLDSTTVQYCYDYVISVHNGDPSAKWNA